MTYTIINHDENWQMPQGGFDEGETAEEAVLRELKEEIGGSVASVDAEIN